MHILFLTDNFPPEVNAPASRTFEHCREWVKAGHKVTVITCVPNFPQGKVYENYKNKLWQTETMAGIQVIRVWTYITANEGFVKRVLDYISYMMAAIFASPFVKKPDVVVATSPTLFAAMAGYMVGVLKRIPFVFELRDLWPESIKAVGALKEDSFIIRFLEVIEMFLYRKASRIVTVTHAFKKNLVKRGIEAEKIDIITNGVDLERFKPQEKDPELLEQYALQDKFVAGYIGTHGMAHALETLLDAAKKLKDLGVNDVCILLLGHGARKQLLIEKAQSMGLENVVFIESVSKDEVCRYWSLLDVSIIHLKNTPLFTTVIPSKLFEGMAMGIPVLHGVAGESADIVQREGCGLVFESENAESLFGLLMRLKNEQPFYNELKLNALKNASKYKRSELASKMLLILTDL
ncbi:Glycosyl transferase, group 1 [hydrothermal vent metagenome]|uniref:Glycosyl transferase, group 1 n=1 Tax=hydrothermal vent metagenome TaxID=652676 RepID=A0A3B0YVJ1_9ZZZZ